MFTVARRFLTKETLKIAGCELSVTKERRSETGSAENDREDSSSEIYRDSITDDVLDRCVFIENVPEDMCDFLEVVIENRSKGGGAVEMFEPDPARGGVLVRFVDQQGALLTSFIF